MSRLAAQAADVCTGVRTPGLRAAAAPAPEALSRREREVALLAAGGCTSREIAERLFLSPRTVENHLARVYGKLGVTGRDDLAAALD
jgi:DNA-binding CsgD family transcriptional regulator